MNTGAVMKVAALFNVQICNVLDPSESGGLALKKRKVIISDNLSEVPSGFEPL